jgi:spore germination protein
MIIHVVQEGETIDSIAEKYSISAERLILENEIKNPNRLVVGETLVILFPEVLYTIQEGDTLTGIADYFDVTVMQLLRNNPYLSNREYIYPGETIVISYKDNKITKLSTTGFAYPFIDEDVLKKTLPFLTYLTIFSYMFTAEGEIIDINDAEIIQIAKEYGVASIMMLTALATSQIDEINVTNNILSSQDVQDQFIENVLSILKTKGYYGVNINTPYIFPKNRNDYVDFITKFTNRIQSEGFKVVFDTLSLTVFEIMIGTMYEGLEYSRLGNAIDRVMLMTYEWGNIIGIPAGIISFDTIRKYLDYISMQITPEKIIIGAPIIGYVWELPYVAGVSKGLAITYDSAVELARNVGAVIQYNEITKATYFQYVNANEYIVLFRDARSIDAYVKLIPEYGFNGVSIWNIMSYFPQMWMVINSQYEIEKI